MAKKRTSAQQASLFKQDIPEMPEGYYSSGPNPNLRGFVEEHATAYDPDTDDYNLPSFDQPIATTKNSVIYGMHSYHLGKKPYDAILQYVEHYTEPGDLVLDPMCGSGSSVLAALIEGCAAVAVDLSPAATFITKNYCSPVDEKQLGRALGRLKDEVKSEIDWLYETRCDRCEGAANTEYTVYSQTFRCPRCLEIIALFDCAEAVGQTRSGKPKKIKVCPYCHDLGHVEEIKTTGERYGIVPVMVSYTCQDGCVPKRDKRRHSDPDPRKRLYFRQYDLGKIEEIKQQRIPYWYPDADLVDKIPYRMLHKKDFRPSDASRLSDFFTKRNLWALALVVSAAGDNGDLRLMIQAAILASSRRAQHLEGGGGYIPGTYHLPQMAKERNVWGVLTRVANKALRARSAITKRLRSTCLLISTETATSLSQIPTTSIDYIFTDPVLTP